MSSHITGINTYDNRCVGNDDSVKQSWVTNIAQYQIELMKKVINHFPGHIQTLV